MFIQVNGLDPEIEVHKEAQHLYGYHGDQRVQKAHIIVRRKFVQAAANDIGFERQPDGTYRAWISEFDSVVFNDQWMGHMKQLYGVEKTTAIAKKKGFKVNTEKLENGQIKLTLRR
jgi:hypothetical protein